MSDLRKTFLRLQRQWGHNVLLQRRLPDVVEGPHPRAQYSNKLERYTVRRMHSSSAGLTHMAEDRPEGLVTTVDLIYWFEWTVNPKEGDRIYDQEENLAGRQATWLIDYAQPMRGIRGRIEFWTVGVTREGPD